jgi:hypothetical protein
MRNDPQYISHPVRNVITMVIRNNELSVHKTKRHRTNFFSPYEAQVSIFENCF